MQGRKGIFHSEHRKGNDKLRDLGVDGSIKLKRLLKNLNSWCVHPVAICHK
jgi:hypothetical protein